MKSSLHAPLLLLFAAATVLAVLTPPAPASAASIGTLTLLDARGKPMLVVDAASLPSFSTAVASGACPTGFQEATRLQLVAGATNAVMTSNRGIVDASAQARADQDTPLADYSTAASLSVRLQCLDIQNGIGVASASYYEAVLTRVSGTLYSVSPVPTITVEQTTVSLGVSPAATVVEGTTLTLTATTTPAFAPGEVTFRDGSTVLATVASSAGTASLTLPSSLAVGAHSFTAEFAPDEPLYFSESATAVATTVTVVAPVATAPAAPGGLESVLAATGVFLGPIVVVGLIVALLGAILVVVRRRLTA